MRHEYGNEQKTTKDQPNRPQNQLVSEISENNPPESFSVEELLAMSGEMASSSREIFGQLDTVDMKFGTIKDSQGIERELSHGNFLTFMQDPDRETRKNAFMQYYMAYCDHKAQYPASLSGSVQKRLVLCKGQENMNPA